MGTIEARQDPRFAPYYKQAERQADTPEARAALAGQRAAVNEEVTGFGLSLVPGVQEAGIAAKARRVYQAAKQGGLSAGARQAFNEWVDVLPFVGTAREAQAASNASVAHDAHGEAYHRTRTGFNAAGDALVVIGGVEGVRATRAPVRVSQIETPIIPEIEPVVPTPSEPTAPLKKAGTTRQGITRKNASEWRALRDLWDQRDTGTS